MKKKVAIASLVALGLYGILLFIAIATPLRPCAPFGNKVIWMTPAGDFRVRLNGIQCLRSGTNPYDVWRGAVSKEPYVPLGGDVEHTDGPTEYINSDVPWSYSLLMPLAFLPLRIAYVVFFLAQVAGLCLLLFIGLSVAKSLGLGQHGACIAAAGAILLTGLPLGRDFESGNLAIISLTGAVLMAICLNRGKRVLAGICWAVAMIKPQVGLVFAIPLLMRKEFLTCFVAAALCLLLSIPPALMCHTSLWDMITLAPNANVYCYYGSGTFPWSLFQFIPKEPSIFIGVAIGAVVCVFMTRMMSRQKDWFLYMLPAFIMAPAWTYSLCYCHSYNWLFFLVLLCCIAKTPSSKALWLILFASLPLSTRVFNVVHFAGMLRPELTTGKLSFLFDNYGAIDSLITTASLALGILLCLRLSRRDAVA